MDSGFQEIDREREIEIGRERSRERDRERERERDRAPDGVGRTVDSRISTNFYVGHRALCEPNLWLLFLRPFVLLKLSRNPTSREI